MLLFFRRRRDYYYGDRAGLKQPPLNGLLKPQVKIAAYNHAGDNLGDHCKDCRVLGLIQRIRIWRNANLTSENLYATVLHELAHASHWELRKGKWNITHSKVKESWATGVQWVLGRLRYPDYEGRRFDINNPDYTLIVADMIDDTTTDNTNFGFQDNRDQVEGYTIVEIENVLANTTTWQDWENNIINTYNNLTEDNLGPLFRNHEER